MAKSVNKVRESRGEAVGRPFAIIVFEEAYRGNILQHA